MKIPDIRLSLTITAFACLLAACGKKEEPKTAVPAQGPSGPPKPAAVDYMVVNTQVLERKLFTTGNLLANELVDVRPERSGRLTSIKFQEGTLVQKGALLGELDRQELEAQFAKLKVNEAYYERELKRAKELLNIDGIAEEEYDRIALSLDQTRADIRLTQVALDKTYIRAPFSGRLGLRQISEGAYVSPSDVLISLQQTDPIKMEFQVPERYVRDLKPGQQLNFTVEGLNDTYKAQVYAIGNQVEANTRTLTIRARCANPRGQLLPGNFAKVEVVTGENRSAVLVPTDAVIPVLNGQQVLVVNKGKVAMKPVQTGQRLESYISITEGLTTGDTVILSGLLSLKEGTSVGPQNLMDP